MTDPLPPYARLLGLSLRREADGTVWVMPFAEAVVGRPGFLHGGAIAGLLEFAALGAVHELLEPGAHTGMKPINVTVDFLRGGGDHETYASATVSRLGSRVANVEAHAWQSDRRKPIASATMNVLLSRR